MRLVAAEGSRVSRSPTSAGVNAPLAIFEPHFPGCVDSLRVRETGVLVRLNAVWCCCGVGLLTPQLDGQSLLPSVRLTRLELREGKSRHQWISSRSPYSFSQPAGAHSSESSYFHLCVVLAQAVVIGLQHGGTWHSGVYDFLQHWATVELHFILTMAL